MNIERDIHFGLSEVVLRTPEYERLCGFYTTVFRGPPTVDMRPTNADSTDPDSPTRIAFYELGGQYPVTQRVAIFECADVGGRKRRAVGLHHLQIRFPDHDSLLETYEQLKTTDARVIKANNHGIAVSFYYSDPDGNTLEISAMNYPTEKLMREHMATDAYRRNPSGVAIDPEDLVERRRRGETLADLLRIP